MTPMFDEFDKDLREALASEELPPAGFTDRVMARVTETPQQKKAPAPYRRWLVSAAACLVVAAALIPLLRGGGLGGKESCDMAAADSGADAADQQMMMQSAPPASGAPDENTSQDIAQQKNGADNGKGSGSAGNADTAPADTVDDTDTTSKAPRHDTEYAAAPSSAMDDALARAADTLTAQGYTLTVTAREDDRVQVTLTDDTGTPADAALAAAMEAEGFAAAADGWYTYEEDTNP